MNQESYTLIIDSDKPYTQDIKGLEQLKNKIKELFKVSEDNNTPLFFDVFDNNENNITDEIIQDEDW